MNQQPLDLLSEDDRKELERLLSIVHSETLSTAAKLEEVARRPTESRLRYGVITQRAGLACLN